MEIISIDRNNIEQEHICCAIGNDAENRSRAALKKEWMKARFEEGLVFKRLDARGKVFVEYMPVEQAWKPVVGSNYLIINCLWVSGQYKGQGLSTRLLQECISDAQSQHKDGIVVVSSNKVKPFLTDKKFYLKHGFQVVDHAFPYFELLALKLNPDAAVPQFTEAARRGAHAHESGFSLVYSNQCPFMDAYAKRYAELIAKHGIPCTLTKLNSAAEAQALGSPFGTLGIYYNGVFQMHELLTEEKFEKFIVTV